MIIMANRKIAVVIIIVVIVILCLALLFGMFFTNKPSSSSQIFIEQNWEYNDSPPHKIEITDSEDYSFLLTLFSKRRLVLPDSPSCPFETLKITFEHNGKSLDFYPATDSCSIVQYGDKDKYFNISDEDRERLCKLWQKYGFQEIYI